MVALPPPQLLIVFSPIRINWIAYSRNNLTLRHSDGDSARILLILIRIRTVKVLIISIGRRENPNEAEQEYSHDDGNLLGNAKVPVQLHLGCSPSAGEKRRTIHYLASA